MYIKNIKLKNYRSYRNLEIEFNKKTNILIGNNAQGKTNILEAIYLMCLAKSFRTNKDKEMIKFMEEKAFIKCISVNEYEEETEIEIQIEKIAKIIKINGKEITKKSDILNNVNIVIFSPEDLKIIKEEPEKRRVFLDREISQIKPLYFKNLSKYKKILMQKNSLLKIENVNKELIDVWNIELINYAAKIIKDRSIFINKINKISRKIHNSITSNEECLKIEYETKYEIKTDEQEQKEVLIEAIKKRTKDELKRRVSLVGPHRDDLKISINNVDVRNFGSQGQQRTAALSLKLAEIELIKEETKENPILLLDDVLSELDINRQNFLIESLKDLQLFLTTTEISDIIKEKIKEKTFFKVYTVEKESHINKNFT